MELPIKRHIALQPLSHDHHQGLLVCWKIKSGLDNKVDLKRIKAFLDFYFEHHLKGHFDLEENYIFTILGNDHFLIQQALAEHRMLRSLFAKHEDLAHVIPDIGSCLRGHIRFEERILFNEIQKVATEEQFARISEMHADNNREINELIESWKDPFWEQGETIK